METLLHGCFSRFLNCTNGTKSRNASHLYSKNNWLFSKYYLFHDGTWRFVLYFSRTSLLLSLKWKLSFITLGCFIIRFVDFSTQGSQSIYVHSNFSSFWTFPKEDFIRRRILLNKNRRTLLWIPSILLHQNKFIQRGSNYNVKLRKHA